MDGKSRGVGKTESFNSQERGWLLTAFFFPFSNHENYGIKNICIYSKSKIKAKVPFKQSLENFKMINRRLLIPNFSNNSNMLLSSSWAIFIRVLVFVFNKGQLFFVWVLMIFVSTYFSIHSYLVHKSKNRKNNYIFIKIEKFQLCFIIYFDTTNHSHIKKILKGLFVIVDMSWLEDFLKFNKQGMLNKNVLSGIFSKNYGGGGEGW